MEKIFSEPEFFNGVHVVSDLFGPVRCDRKTSGLTYAFNILSFSTKPCFMLLVVFPKTVWVSSLAYGILGALV